MTQRATVSFAQLRRVTSRRGCSQRRMRLRAPCWWRSGCTRTSSPSDAGSRLRSGAELRPQGDDGDVARQRQCDETFDLGDAEATRSLLESARDACRLGRRAARRVGSPPEDAHATEEPPGGHPLDVARTGRLMLVISVELLHGTFRGDPDGTANTGHLTRGEWPPSPARLFAALVAADGTQAAVPGDRRGGAGVVRAVAAAGHSRPRTALPSTARAAIRRPAQGERGQGNVHQEYVGRIGVQSTGPGRGSRRGIPASSTRMEHRRRRLQEILDALRRRAARVGYLGASDSPVRVRVAATDVPGGRLERHLHARPGGATW